MSTQVKRRRGTAAENAAFTGAQGEITYITDDKRLAVHDATTAGGFGIPNHIDMLKGSMTRATASGTNTYSITLPFFPSSYSDGLEIEVTFTNANTGSCTLNVNGIGANNLKDESGANFTSGQIEAGSRHTFRHNGTEWRQRSAAAGLTVAAQVFTSSGTYTPTTGMKYCIVELVGGGGGGGGNSGGGGTGGTTSLGGLLSATGGTGGTANSTTSSGGTGGSGSSGDFNLSGGNGNGGFLTGTASRSAGGTGGGSFFGQGGAMVMATGSSAAGAAGKAYGGGGGGGVTLGTNAGGGGGGGGYARKTFSAATIGGSQSVTVGAAGAAGAAGPNQPGGAGTAGIVIITEFL